LFNLKRMYYFLVSHDYEEKHFIRCILVNTFIHLRHALPVTYTIYNLFYSYYRYWSLCNQVFFQGNKRILYWGETNEQIRSGTFCGSFRPQCLVITGSIRISILKRPYSNLGSYRVHYGRILPVSVLCSENQKV
jgi:hypothetical protein